MTALSIHLPESVSKESALVAKELGVSRNEFIKQAVIHELDSFKRKTAEDKIIKSFAAMKKSVSYQQEIQELENLDDDLPQERDFWWKKK